METPIRVLHIVSGMKMGGIETYLMNLYRAIDRSKVQFDFLIHLKSEDGFENEIRQLGGQIYYQPRFETSPCHYGRSIDNFFREHTEYSIIHIHIRSVATLCAWEAKKNNRLVIVHSHSTTNGYGVSAKCKDILQFPVRYVADYFMGCSYEANEWMFGKKIAHSKKCQVLQNGIDVEKFLFNRQKRNDIRKQLGVCNNEFVIGNVGRLVEQKNQKLLISAFARALTAKSNLKLVIVGDGPLLSELKAMAKIEDVADKIVFLGNRKDVPNLLQAFDLFVMPSKNEGLGIAVIEAQAAGLHTVVSPAIPKEAYITSLVQKCTGDKIEDWAKEIMRCKRYKRHDKAEMIKKAGYDIKQIAQQLCDFYCKRY